MAGVEACDHTAKINQQTAVADSSHFMTNDVEFKAPRDTHDAIGTTMLQFCKSLLPGWIISNILPLNTGQNSNSEKSTTPREVFYSSKFIVKHQTTREETDQ